MSGTTTRGGHIGVSDAGLRPHLRPGRRAIRKRRLSKGGTFWAGSSTSTKLRHVFLYPTGNSVGRLGVDELASLRKAPPGWGARPIRWRLGASSLDPSGASLVHQPRPLL